MRAIRTPARTLFLVFDYLILTLVGIICLAPCGIHYAHHFLRRRPSQPIKDFFFFRKADLRLKAMRLFFRTCPFGKAI